MKLQINHHLIYTYSSAILLDPQLLYIYPRRLPHQTLIDYKLTISPNPSNISINLDSEGNVQQFVFFPQNSVNTLEVNVDIVLQSEEINSLQFVLYPFETKQFPFLYDQRINKYLVPYLARTDITIKVEQFARKIAAEVHWETVPFLVRLAEYISTEFVYEHRETGAAYSPEEILKFRVGSCRDYSRLYISTCRSLGIAARFVSGYLFGNLLQDHELHAWAEVYLPGAGWRGFDPTIGSTISANHVSVAASADFNSIAPVMGSFRGNATSKLTTEVSIQQINC
jgi:transglutaminase-like putative cysteine protease